MQCWTLKDRIEECKKAVLDPVPICVKMDCEGAEQEIFEDEEWLKDVSLVLLEFHNADGPRYREILERHGFYVTCNDNNPKAVRAIIRASREQRV